MPNTTYVDESAFSDEPDLSRGRRWFLKGLGVAGLGSLAGCLGGDDDEVDTDGLTEVHSAELWGPTAEDGINHRTARLAYEAIEEELPFPFEFVAQRHSRSVDLAFWEHDFDVWYSMQTLRPERVDPHNLLVGNLRRTNNSCGGFNISAYDNDAAEELFDEAVRTIDEDDRRDIIYQIQEELATLEGDVEFSSERSIVFPIWPQIWNSDKFGNVTETQGLGIRNIWTFNEIEPLTDDEDLVVVMTSETSNVNPLVSGAGNRSAVRNVFDNLTRMGPDGLPEPWLATDWDVSEDNQTFTFEIRDGVEFHDGEPLTAADVEFAYQYHRDHSPFFGGDLEGFTEMEAVDDTTVRFELEEPFAPIFTQVFNRIPILPQHIWENVPDNVDVSEAFEWAAHEEEGGMIGSGHMIFDYWDIGSEIRVYRNPDHWRPANIESIVFRVVLDDSAMISGIESGDFDLLWDVGGASPSTIVDVSEENDHLSYREVLGAGNRVNIMNTETGPFSFPEVRAAIECVIPKQTIVNEVWDGLAAEGQGQNSPGIEFWYNDDQKRWGQTYQGREEAIEILEDRGFVVENDTVYYPEGEEPPEQLDGYGC